MTTGWQLIETAPKDGTAIWAFFPGWKGWFRFIAPAGGLPHLHVTHWDIKKSCWLKAPAWKEPTHWMPLPDPSK